MAWGLIPSWSEGDFFPLATTEQRLQKNRLPSTTGKETHMGHSSPRVLPLALVQNRASPRQRGLFSVSAPFLLIQCLTDTGTSPRFSAPSSQSKLCLHYTLLQPAFPEEPCVAHPEEVTSLLLKARGVCDGLGSHKEGCADSWYAQHCRSSSLSFSPAELHSFFPSFVAANCSGDKNSYCCKSWKL